MREHDYDQRLLSTLHHATSTHHLSLPLPKSENRNVIQTRTDFHRAVMPRVTPLARCPASSQLRVIMSTPPASLLARRVRVSSQAPSGSGSNDNPPIPPPPRHHWRGRAANMHSASHSHNHSSARSYGACPSLAASPAAPRNSMQILTRRRAPHPERKALGNARTRARSRHLALSAGVRGS